MISSFAIDDYYILMLKLQIINVFSLYIPIGFSARSN